jgi:outer membrane lipoprotein-sorting protein
MKKTRSTVSVLILWVMILPFSGNGQTDSFKPIQNLSEFKKTFSVESKKVKSITSSFRQEKVLSLLEEKMVSDGKFWFQRENKIRIEYQKPFEYVLIIRGDEIIIKDHDKQNRINVKSNKLFQQINQIILDCVQGSILDNNDFSVVALENSKSYRLEMKPLTKGLKDFFTEIIVMVDKNDFTASQLSLYEAGGDYTTIYFSNKTLNANIPDSVFDIAK